MTEPKLCNETGPGLVPDPNVRCALEPGHDGRHRWVGEDSYGNTQRTEWGSSGPSNAPCSAPPPLPFGEGMPVFVCYLAPGHGGSHEWKGASDVGVPVLMLWNDSQMVIQLGAEPEHGAPSEARAVQHPNQDVHFDPEAPASSERERELDEREAELAQREADLAQRQPPLVKPAIGATKKAPAKKATAAKKAAPAGARRG